MGSLCQARVVSTLGGVALAGGTWRSRLTVGPGISWLSLGSGLSRASIFTITRHTCRAWRWEKSFNKLCQNWTSSESRCRTWKPYLWAREGRALLFHQCQALPFLPLLLCRLTRSRGHKHNFLINKLFSLKRKKSLKGSAQHRTSLIYMCFSQMCEPVWNMITARGVKQGAEVNITSVITPSLTG